MPFHELFRHSPHQILEGALNVNEVFEHVASLGNMSVLHRYEKYNSHIFDSLAFEYDDIGFTKLGGTFRRRTQMEQYQFLEHCTRLGLKVQPTLAITETYTENVYFENAQTLDEFLLNATSEQAERCTYDIFMDLHAAHNAGIVYGDRWEKNILIVRDVGLVHIDFDIEISGPYAKEFEAAQIACYILAGTDDTIIPLLANLLRTPYARLNIQILEKFLRGHARNYDHEHKYKNIENKLNALIALIYAQE